ncbi:3-oxoacyl-ACP synthase [candidate division KSB1 bacterium 4484_188]|nr:MAG: 3-oxoacyl-ACP synthase [candidate division KSB1 bacterium 4484_188]
MKRARIAGVGHYVPERVVTNFDLEKLMDTSDEWIRERTGIVERRWVEEGETVSGLGQKAATMALERAGIDVSDIECIVFATMASDHEFPGAGCFLQEKLEIPGIPALDVRNQCSGFLYGLSVADMFIRTETYRNVLLVGAEIQSTGLDLTTRGRDMAVLFGDGAGAVVLVASDEPERGVLTTHLHADGKYTKKLWGQYPSVTHHPRVAPEMLEGDGIYPKMEGRYVFKHAVTRFPEVIHEALKATGYSIDDVDLVVPHQANQRITEAVAQRLGIGMDKMFSNIHKYGNTTAATIPICLSEARAEGRIKDGDLVALAAFGSGFTWASALVRW